MATPKAVVVCAQSQSATVAAPGPWGDRTGTGVARWSSPQVRVAVVTGAGSGIGLALAERFAAAGLHLVVGDVQQDRAGRGRGAVREHGVEVLPVRLDVSKEAEVQDLARQTIDRFGAVHVVCNNAGVAGRDDPSFGPISSWEWVMGVNFWGVVHGCRAFLPLLAAGGGHIVNTASIAGLTTGFAPATTRPSTPSWR